MTSGTLMSSLTREISIEGFFYAHKSIVGVPSSLFLDNDNLVILGDDHSEIQRFSVSEIKTSDRIGNIPRTLYFQTDYKFTTADNDLVDELLRQIGIEKKRSLLYLLENNWKVAFTSFLGVVFLYYFIFTFLIPKFSQQIATYIPQSFKETVSQKGIDYFEEKKYFLKSKLTKAQRLHYSNLFSKVIKDFSQYDLKLSFYSSPLIGANAFAFPNGQIVVTDEFINILSDDIEFTAILYHEIGHVHFNHGMEGLLRGAATSMLISMILGDAGSITVPVIFLQNSYSQEMETQSDLFALTELKKNSIDKKYYAQIMKSLHKPIDDETDFPELPNFLSTHPSLNQRLEAIENFDQI
jgi:Zn-dependent protease with chaperone function